MSKDLVETIQKLFYYKEGKVFRKTSSGGKLKDTEAGSLHHSGYFIVRVKGKHYQRSHITWALNYGKMPNEIDHIDQNKSNDLISNLREATRQQNTCNRKKWRGREKYKGVYQVANGKFSVQIRYKGKLETLGTFVDEEEAKEVYDQRCKELFGEFAKPNG